MTVSSRTKGLLNATVSSLTFGLIPLFSVPALKAGIETPSVLIYRFGIGAILIALVMLAMHRPIRVSWEQFWRIAVLAFFSTAGAVTLVCGYEYMPTGPATTIQFSYPVFTCLIMMVFFNERLTLRTAFAVVLAVLGVMGLSGVDFSSSEGFSSIGLILELLAGLTYAIYLVLVPVLKVGEVESFKLTFWVFAISVVYLVLWALCTPAGVQGVPSFEVGVSLVLLALIPTALSNFTVIVALRHVGSTVTSILGAFEPFSAMVVGIIVFNEPLTPVIGVAFVAIIAAVLLLITKKRGE